MSEIRVQCIDQAISFLNTPVISSGNVNYDRIVFDFCSRWDGYAKTAIFYRNKDEVYYQLLENDSCLIPNEVLGDKGIIYLGVFGTRGDQTITSQVLTYRIQEGAVTEDLKPSDPTPDIYEQIISRYNHYDERLAYFENRFNSSVGDAEKLGGQMPDYYATAESVRNIQTTSRVAMNAPGWYRVAEYAGSSESNATGTRGNSCKLLIRQQGASTSVYELFLESVANSQRFFTLSARTLTPDKQRITKIRYTIEGTKAYLEVYYNTSSALMVMFTVTDGRDNATTWQAITPTLTSETVSGVTVTTTYDIPANANPVTDLDLAQVDGTEVLNTSILEKAVNLENGFHVFRLGGGSYTGGDLPATLYAYGLASVFKWGGNIVVELHGHGNSATKKTAYNYYVDSAWKGWDTNIMQADLTTALANYVTNSNASITNVLTIGSDSSSGQKTLGMRNTNRIILQQLKDTGEYIFYDGTNAKRIFTSTADGTNTFNGTASGNLPLDGGGTVNGNIMVSADNTNARAVGIYNSVRKIYHQVLEDGRYRLADITNGKDIISSTANGTNTFSGTASGNLPLNGGTVTGASTAHPLALDTDKDYILLKYLIGGQTAGYLGFLGVDVPVYTTSSGSSKKLLHEGNSAKVTITNSESDVPSEMSGLWAY